MAVRPSGSFRRYLLPALRPRPDDERFFARLRDHRFRSIDDQPVDAPSVGWVAPGTFGSSDFRPDTIFLGRNLRLRMRIDRKKLPTNALRVRLSDALARMGGGKVTRAAMTKLREDVQKELLARALPSTAVIDAYWRPDADTILVTTTEANANAAFVRLFKETFGHVPEAASPTPLALKAGIQGLDADRLRRLSPLQVAAHATSHATAEEGDDAA